MASSRRPNLSEQVAVWIKQMILDEGLKPGDRLPTEQEMATRFGVSRVSVREATKALSFLGIIRAAPRRGLTIGEVDMARVTEYLGFHFALSNFPRQQLLNARVVIETGAIPFVAGAMDRDRAIGARFEALLLQGRSAATDAERVQHDVDFHRLLLESSDVAPLLVFDNLLQIFFEAFTGKVPDDVWQQTLTEHAEIVRLLSAGQVDQAQAKLLAHLGNPQQDLHLSGPATETGG